MMNSSISFNPEPTMRKMPIEGIICLGFFGTLFIGIVISFFIVIFKNNCCCYCRRCQHQQKDIINDEHDIEYPRTPLD